MSVMVLDPTEERAYRQEVSSILGDLEVVVGDLRGAEQQEIDQVCERTELERLPVAVDEYMRIVGSDDDICQHMFPGVSGLSIPSVLRAELDWVCHGGRIPYVVSDTVLWLGAADPPTFVDAYDPVVWTLRGGSDTPTAGGRFTADLERRVLAGIKSLRELRRGVEEEGFCDMDPAAIDDYAAEKSARHRRSMERLLSIEFDDELFSRMQVMIVESVNRDVALYRRLQR